MLPGPHAFAAAAQPADSAAPAWPRRRDLMNLPVSIFTGQAVTHIESTAQVSMPSYW